MILLHNLHTLHILHILNDIVSGGEDVEGDPARFHLCHPPRGTSQSWFRSAFVFSLFLNPAFKTTGQFLFSIFFSFHCRVSWLKIDCSFCSPNVFVVSAWTSLREGPVGMVEARP